MKIAYLTGEYPRATDTFIQREVFTLRKQGLEIHTFAIRKPGDEHIVGEEQKLERNHTFYILPANIISLIVAHISLFFASPTRYLKSLLLAWKIRQGGIKGFIYQIFYWLEAAILAREIKKRGISHLHNHLASSSCTVAMLASTMGGFSYSFTMHGPHVFFEPYRWRLDQKIKTAALVICISHFCRSQGMIFAHPRDWQKMKIIHCGIEPELFPPISPSELGQRVLYIGRLAPEKGVPILLESIVHLKNKIPELVLTIIGDGPYRLELEQMARNLELTEQVRFVGYKSQVEVREYIQKTDILVHPSFAEGIPVVLMEAMAAGVPIIATQIAGVGELVENGKHGYLVPPGDAFSLAEAIKKLLTDKQLRETISEQSRMKVAEQFNLNIEMAKLYDIFQSTLKSRLS